MTKAMPFLQKAILLSYDPRRFWRGNFFPAAPGESKFIPDSGNPRWSTKKSPRLLAGRFFLAAPGESKFIPDRGNPRWSTKKSPRLLARRFFSGCSRGVEVYPRQGKSPLEHQKSFISKGWTFHRARDKIE